MSELNKYNLNQETLPKFKSCFDLNGSPKDIDKIEWQYFKNTEKSNLVEISYDKNAQKTAGIYAISNVRFKLGDEEMIGAQSLDTIVDINYRGRGLFTKLAKSVYDKAKESNIALVYGFPNGNSIHGFSKKLNWEVLDPVPFLIKPLRTKYFTNKIKYLKFLPNIKISYSKYKKGYDT